MMDLKVETIVTLSVLVTITLAVLRLAFQSGTANQTLQALTGKVDDLVRWMEQARSENALVRVEIARIIARFESVERRLDRMEDPRK